MSGIHGEQSVTDGIHISYSWVFADTTAREVTTDPNTNVAYSASNIGKFARQLDDNSIWMLTATTPTWTKVGGGLAEKFTIVQDDVNSVIQLKVTDPNYDLALLPEQGNDGWVGINTVEPETQLEVVGFGPVFQIRSTSLVNPIDIDFQFSAASVSGAAAARIEAGLDTGKGELAISAGGNSVTDCTEVMRFNKDLQVLVGTTTAVGTELLNVAGNIVLENTGHAEFLIKSDSLSAYLELNAVGGGGREYRIYSSNSGDFNVYDQTLGSTRLRITSTGQVLIGTTTATTGAQLDVAGDIVVSDGAGNADVTISDGLIQHKYLKTVSGNMSTIVATSGTGSITLSRAIDDYKNYIVRVSIIASHSLNSTNSVLFEEISAFSIKQTGTSLDRATNNLITYTGAGISITRVLGTGSVTYTITNGSALDLNNTAYSVDVLSGNISELTISST